ncbi:SDR family NAD(P)-dependent oxidoreductase [Rivularia sp. UHCC 0363]|nr:SDR family NAD(P)-dependent oxidoreductase [Rivularia sp. UHCC 0363]MEA5594306.1 SDR family NAD(P)-dependent oxidoreductase [Rivularia sp. UHCC 0363]
MINQNSVCLITGGGKGITAKSAIKIAQEYKCKFVLLGRSPLSNTPEPAWVNDCSSEVELKRRILERLVADGEKPTPIVVQREYQTIATRREIEQTLAAIAQAGGKAEYLSVDVTVEDVLQQKLAEVQQRLGKITAIVHGAGNLADKPIEKKTESDFDRVYNPKVKGLTNLLKCVPPSQLDSLVLFSSVVGFYGNAGQTDYSIANETLNKTAYLIKQQYPDCHVVAINWGPWDSGMVSPELKRAFAQRNIETIPVEVGTQMLIEELAAEDTQIIIGSPLTPSPVALDSELKNYRIRRCLKLTDNPFLQDHVIAGYPVLPATCAINWIANTCEQLYPGYKFFSVQNYKVLKGIIFDDSLATEYILDLEEISKNNGNEVVLDAKISSKNKQGKTRYHFSEEIILKQQINHAPLYNLFDLTVDNNSFTSREEIYQKGGASLFHGTAFQGIEKVLNISPEKITIQCNLATVELEKQGQFPVQAFNPYIVDVQIHSLWLWVQHFHQCGCLPSGIMTYEQFACIPFSETFYISCEINSKTETAAVAQIIAHDRQGKIYTRIQQAKGTILPIKLAKQ